MIRTTYEVYTFPLTVGHVHIGGQREYRDGTVLKEYNVYFAFQPNEGNPVPSQKFSSFREAKNALLSSNVLSPEILSQIPRDLSKWVGPKESYAKWWEKGGPDFQ